MDTADATTAIRVLIVDDDPGIRLLLEVTIGLHAEFDLAGSASSARELRAWIAENSTRLDLVLLDVTLPDANGIDLITEIRALVPTVHIALFTGWSDPDVDRRAHAAGADGVFAKDGDPTWLLEQLQDLVAGEPPRPLRRGQRRY